MPNTMFQETLNYLYREMKLTKVKQAYAEKREDVTPAELINIRTKIDVLDGLIDMVLRDYAVEEVGE